MRFLDRGVSLCAAAARDVLQPESVPGYSSLAWHERCSYNSRALLLFGCSAEFVRLLAWLLVWELGAHYLVWSRDLRGIAAAIPIVLALGWLLPWLARARRRELAQLLGPYWDT
jgi:hypothetical protein